MQDDRIGVGPHPQPWPTGDQYDPMLLSDGDRRNVLDRFRYWRVESIKAALDADRQPLEIAVENVHRDFNMGTIVRNANAFNVSRVHVIGSRQWNKRGAMMTDVYMNIEYHESVESFVAVMDDRGQTILAMDIVEGSLPLSSVDIPLRSVMVFGAEGPGLSEELRSRAAQTVHIEQLGSTRSVNVGVASGIAMYAWLQKHALSN